MDKSSIKLPVWCIGKKMLKKSEKGFFVTDEVKKVTVWFREMVLRYLIATYMMFLYPRRRAIFGSSMILYESTIIG